jgi:tRNA pseudouridine38-40 synthase
MPWPSRQKFRGEHDFASFSANRGTRKQTPSGYRAVRLRRAGPYISMEFDGDGFLYKMVRMLAGTLVRIGLYKSSPQDINARLRSPRNSISRGRHSGTGRRIISDPYDAILLSYPGRWGGHHPPV